MSGRIVRVDDKTYYFTDKQLEALATGRYVQLDEPSFDMRLLWRCCENRHTPSAQALAEEELDSNPYINVELVEWTLQELNLRGLVIYVLGEKGEFRDIRPTLMAYGLLGYPPPVQVLIGRRRIYKYDAVQRPGDVTDFRNLPLHHTYGTPVIVEDAWEHVRWYPEHHHDMEGVQHRSLSEGKGLAPQVSQAHNGGTAGAPGSSDSGGNQVAVHPGPKPAKRPSGYVIPEDEKAAILEDRLNGLTWKQISEKWHHDLAKLSPILKGVAPRNATKRLPGAAKDAKKAQDPTYDKHPSVSLKERILKALAENQGAFATVGDIRTAIAKPGENIDLHNIVHLLYALSRQGWIKFESSKRNSAAGEQILSNIRFTSNGWGRIGGRPERVKEAAASPELVAPAPPPSSAPTAASTAPQRPEEAPLAPPPTPAPVAAQRPETRDTPLLAVGGYPLIQGLLNRRTKVFQASKLLREAGMIAAAELVEAEPETYTPLEEEIVRWIRSSRQ